ncbi:MFS transporter [Paraburkholderia bannensis]|nr:MFS transporter [Paraburkholderia bannensis]
MLKILCLIFIPYVIIGASLSTFPGYVENVLAFSSLFSGIVIGSQYLCTLISRPLAGKNADQWGAKKTVALGMVSLCLCGALTYFSFEITAHPRASLVTLIAGRLALGLAESWIGTGCITWAIRKFGNDETSKIISWGGVFSYGGLTIGASCGLWFTKHFHFVDISYLFIVFGFIGWFVCSRLSGVQVSSVNKIKYRHVFGKVLPYGIILALGSAGFGVIGAFLTLLFQSHGWRGAASALAIFGAFFILARIAFVGAIKRFGSLLTAAISLGVESLGLGLISIDHSEIVSVVGCAIVGGGFALVFPALGVEAVEGVATQNRGTAISAFALFLDFGIGVSGPAAGLIADFWGYRSAFTFSLVLATFATVLVMTVFAKRHSERCSNVY